MLFREKDFSKWFGLNRDQTDSLNENAKSAALQAEGMMDYQDYLAIGAYCLAYRPENIFEIGTYLGTTTNFILNLLPNATVISIAYINPFRLFSRQLYNNSELAKGKIGRNITKKNRYRYRQLFGDSHQLNSKKLAKQFGLFDLVFVDGDHSRKGVELDTKLAKEILNESGAIIWHDANPKEKYKYVQEFLEDMPYHAIGTAPNYIGGVAIWSDDIEDRLISIL